MNGPAIVAVILVALALVAVGFIVTLAIVSSAPRRTYRSDDEGAGEILEVGT